MSVGPLNIAGRPRQNWVTSPVRAFERLSIRAAVLLGFAIILGMWLLASLGSVHRTREAQRRTAEINARFMRNERLLFDVRSEIPMVAVFVRDALLDTSPDGSQFYRAQLQESRKAIESRLAEYIPVVNSPAERENWAQLQAELDDYWTSVWPVLSWDPDQKRFLSQRFLRRNVLRKRNQVLKISERIQALNRVAFDQRQEELAVLYRQMRKQVWETGAASALLALLIAIVVILHAGRLERRILRQHLTELETRNDLRRLSAKLVSAQEEERRNIARELHDEIGQALAALKMEIALAERALGWKDEARTPLKKARAIADRTLQGVRDLSHLLHPAMLDVLGLPDAVNGHLRSFANRTDIEVELVREGVEERLGQQVEVTAYRVIQEALNNVARHSAATRCCVSLVRLPDRLRIRVEDNGKGFDLNSVRKTGLGLIGMQERVSNLGGVLQIESRPGNGTTVIGDIPVDPDSAGEEAPAERSLPAMADSILRSTEPA